MARKKTVKSTEQITDAVTIENEGMEAAVEQHAADLGTNEDLSQPQSRLEEFLANIAGLVDSLPSGEYTRLERYLKYIAQNGSGSSNIAPQFDPTVPVPYGSYVIYNGVLYRCTASPQHSGEWDASHFTAVSVGEELSAIPLQYLAKTAVLLTSSDNTSTILTPGSYYFGRNSIPGGLPSAVTGISGNLYVLPGAASGSTQVCITRRTASMDVYVRIAGSGTYGSWFSITTTAVT